MPSSDFAIRN